MLLASSNCMLIKHVREPVRRVRGWLSGEEQGAWMSGARIRIQHLTSALLFYNGGSGATVVFTPWGCSEHEEARCPAHRAQQPLAGVAALPPIPGCRAAAAGIHSSALAESPCCTSSLSVLQKDAPACKMQDI